MIQTASRIFSSLPDEAITLADRFLRTSGNFILIQSYDSLNNYYWHHRVELVGPCYDTLPYENEPIVLY